MGFFRQNKKGYTLENVHAALFYTNKVDRNQEFVMEKIWDIKKSCIQCFGVHLQNFCSPTAKIVFAWKKIAFPEKQYVRLQNFWRNFLLDTLKNFALTCKTFPQETLHSLALALKYSIVSLPLHISSHPKYFLVKKSNRFEKTCGWINDDRI